VNRHFGEMYEPEDGSDIFLWNVSSHTDHMALYLRWRQHSKLSLWEPHILQLHNAFSKWFSMNSSLSWLCWQIVTDKADIMPQIKTYKWDIWNLNGHAWYRPTLTRGKKVSNQVCIIIYLLTYIFSHYVTAFNLPQWDTYLSASVCGLPHCSLSFMHKYGTLKLHECFKCRLQKENVFLIHYQLSVEGIATSY
jgi:hypothetical protein